MKKLTILCFAILLFFVGCSSGKSSANDFHVSLSKAKCHPGEVVSVTIQFDKVPAGGISSALFNIDYDKTVFTFTKLEAGPIVSDSKKDIAQNADQNIPSGMRILYAGIKSAVKQGGTFCTLYFQTSNTSKLGDYNISIDLSNQMFAFYTQKNQKLPTQLSQGVISVQ